MALQLTTRDIIGTSASRVTLTNAYTGTNQRSGWIRTNNTDQIHLDIWYTMGTAETSNSIQVLVECANPLNDNPNATPDTTAGTGDISQDASLAIVSGTGTLSLHTYTFSSTQTAGTYDTFFIDRPWCSKFLRVSVKETGIASNGGAVHVRLTYREEVA